MMSVLAQSKKCMYNMHSKFHYLLVCGLILTFDCISVLLHGCSKSSCSLYFQAHCIQHVSPVPFFFFFPNNFVLFHCCYFVCNLIFSLLMVLTCVFLHCWCISGSHSLVHSLYLNTVLFLTFFSSIKIFLQEEGLPASLQDSQSGIIELPTPVSLNDILVTL